MTTDTKNARTESADPFDWLDEWLAAGEGRGYLVGRSEWSVLDENAPLGHSLAVLWTVTLIGPSRWAGGIGVARKRLAGSPSIRPGTAFVSGFNNKPASQGATVAAALDMWEQLYGKKVRQ